MDWTIVPCWIRHFLQTPAAQNIRYTRLLFALWLLPLVLLLAACGESEPDGNAAPRNESDTVARYLGPQACVECHRDIYESTLRTAHHRSSMVADSNNVLGSFAAAHNVLNTISGASFRMEQEGAQLYQRVNGRAGGRLIHERIPFGITVGSGRKGQTYLYWLDSLLFQMPVSYHVGVGEWVNSPGYIDGQINLYRPIFPRCLECHATHAELLPNQHNYVNAYNRESMLLGITCEKCHGPGSRHVDYHRSNPGQMRGQYIVNSGKLPRERRLDVCALCHSGARQAERPVLSWRPGQVLDSFLLPEAPGPAQEFDVHGNQLGLLMQSACFRASPNMTCETCHDPHAAERAQPALFSQRCMQCHTPEACGVAGQHTRGALADNCIDCHMPLRESKGLIFEIRGEPYPLVVRSHHIGIYPDAGRNFLQNREK